MSANAKVAAAKAATPRATPGSAATPKHPPPTRRPSPPRAAASAARSSTNSQASPMGDALPLRELPARRVVGSRHYVASGSSSSAICRASPPFTSPRRALSATSAPTAARPWPTPARAGRARCISSTARWRSGAMAAHGPCARRRAGALVRGQRSSAALCGDGRQGRQARAQGAEALMAPSGCTEAMGSYPCALSVLAETSPI